MPIRTCLFDLGNVLLYFSHDKMYRQMAEICGVEPAQMAAWLSEAGLQGAAERGELDDLALAARLQQLANRECDVAALVRASADIFEPHHDMLPLLTELKRQSVRLVLLSNTCHAHIRFCREEWPELFAQFDHQILSYEVGAMKPEAPIFAAALKSIHCEPGECFYTDDIPAYIAAGRTHGLQAEVFTTAEACRSHLRERGIAV